MPSTVFLSSSATIILWCCYSPYVTNKSYFDVESIGFHRELYSTLGDLDWRRFLSTRYQQGIVIASMDFRRLEYCENLSRVLI